MSIPIPDNSEALLQAGDYTALEQAMHDSLKPSGTLSKTFITKEAVNGSVVSKTSGVSVRNIRSRIVFTPTQQIFEKATAVAVDAMYLVEVQMVVGGFGITSFELELKGMCEDGYYLVLDDVQALASSGSDGLPIAMSLDAADEVLKSNSLKLFSTCWDSSQATRTTKFKLRIRAYAGQDNIDFGYGQLFPK